MTSTEIDELARDIGRTEDYRAVAYLQHTYSHYALFGLWDDLGALFTDAGEAIWDGDKVAGPAAIAK